MKKLLLIYFLIFFTLNNLPLLGQVQQAPSYLQKQNYEWAFQGNGFNFNNDTLTLLHPTATSINGGPYAVARFASVCDTAGKLLFYTDGYGIYLGNPLPGNANNFYMPNGYPILNYTLNCSPAGVAVFSQDTIFHVPAADGSVIIPMIDSPGKYYVFTNERDVSLIPSGSGWVFTYYGPCTLYYSVVDMNLNNGYGDVEPGRKGIAIDSNLTDAIEGIPGDNCNIWLLTHDLHNTYKAYNITSAGIDSTPVISTGANITGVFTENYYSEVTCSPNRRKLAAVGATLDDMEISDFDPATGIVSNCIFQYVNTDYNYYLSPNPVFSPDNTKLYVAIEIGHTDSNEIVQYDLSSGSGPWAPVVVDTATMDYADETDCGRLGPDGKVYMRTVVIDYPDAVGIACHPHLLPVNLAFGFSFYPEWGYPLNAVPVLPNHDTVIIKQQLTSCFTDSAVTMTASNTAGWNYVWSDYSEYRLHTNHRTIDTPGVFVLTYNTPGCQYHIDSFIVRYINYTVNLGPDTTFCNGSASSYLLQPHDSTTSSSYQWQDGSSGNTDTATSTGTYWVAVNDQGCVASDTAQVKFIDIRQHLGNDTTFCAEHPILMVLQADAAAGADILWSNGSTGPALQVQDPGIYWVTVKNTPCVASDTIQIHAAYCDCAFGMPNAFTPNGDGKNDVFRPVLPVGCRVQDYLLTIYNRWGQEVFSATTESKGWDGTFNGIPADIGTYRYVVQFDAGTNSERKYQKGDVTLIR